jgi:hypothetical protein
VHTPHALLVLPVLLAHAVSSKYCLCTACVLPVYCLYRMMFATPHCSLFAVVAAAAHRAVVGWVQLYTLLHSCVPQTTSFVVPLPLIA